MKKQMVKAEPVVDFLNEELKAANDPMTIYATIRERSKSEWAAKAKAATA